MRAILMGIATVLLTWFSLVVVHEYGMYKYMKGVHDALSLKHYVLLDSSKIVEVEK